MFRCFSLRVVRLSTIAIVVAVAAWGTSPRRADASLRWSQTQFNAAGATLGGLSSDGGSIAVTLHGSAIGSSLNTSAGAFLTQFLTTGPTGGSVVESYLTFCVDLSTLDPPPPAFLADVSVITSNPGPGSGKPNVRNVLGAGWVMNTLIAEGALTASGSPFTAGLSGVTSAQLNAAAQLAIWEIAFDPGAGSVTDTSSAFYATSTAAGFANASTIANRLIQAWVNAGKPGSPIGFVNYKPLVSGDPFQSQDQIFAVPEPSLTALALSGAIALGLGRRVVRRRPDA